MDNALLGITPTTHPKVDSVLRSSLFAMSLDYNMRRNRAVVYVEDLYHNTWLVNDSILNLNV